MCVSDFSTLKQEFLTENPLSGPRIEEKFRKWSIRTSLHESFNRRN